VVAAAELEQASSGLKTLGLKEDLSFPAAVLELTAEG
jgi:hypothetical protein